MCCVDFSLQPAALVAILSLDHLFVKDGGSSLTNEKDHHYFLNRFVCVGEFFDG